jgi:hypothetical protein
MNTILLLLIFTGLVGLLLVVFYVLDRVNELHQFSVKAAEKLPASADPSFGSLSGKDLWDAMAGIPMPGWSAKKLEQLKQRYELVLQKHIELLFEDGKLDAHEGFSMPVSCDRVVPTLRGEIESWMPHEYASGIYRAGHNLKTMPEEEHDQILELLDKTGADLFSATGLPPRPLTQILMPNQRKPVKEEDAEETQALAESEEAGLAFPELPPPDRYDEHDAMVDQAGMRLTPEEELVAAPQTEAAPPAEAMEIPVTAEKSPVPVASKA